MTNTAKLTVLCLYSGLLLAGCLEQYNPTGDWKKFRHESNQANKPITKLTDSFAIPEPTKEQVTEGGQSVADQKFATFCATCHGATGEGNGPAGASMNPKPRNFVSWTDDVTDDYIAKVIREGGAAVGKSPLMTAWGGVLKEDDIKALVGKVRSFRKK